MAVLDIITVPHPILSARARAVRDDEFGDELAKLLSDMAETMYAAPGVGLAAPQVSDSRRVLVVDSGEGEERGRDLLRMVNPKIVARGKETILWTETCLSVPDFEVQVKRNRQITVEWRDGHGERHVRECSDYEAVIVQHELDHLQGTVLLDRASAFKRSRYLKKRKRLASPDEVPFL